MSASATTHLDYIAARLADEPALARFASRLSVAGGADEVVVTLAGRSLSIRPSGHGLVVGGDEVGLGVAPADTLVHVVNRLAIRLSQMDG